MASITKTFHTNLIRIICLYLETLAMTERGPLATVRLPELFLIKK